MTADRPMTARWVVVEDAETVGLQIELWNDHAVTLTCWRNGDPPKVTLWHGSGEHSFIEPGETPERFKRWLDGAQGRR